MGVLAPRGMDQTPQPAWRLIWHEMITKAIRVGIPIAASISAPTSLAVQLAEDRGLTLIGYLRGGRMNVYTHSERLQGA